MLNIETKRFLLRPLTPDDVNDDYIGWWNDAEIQAGLNFLPRNWERFHAVRHVRRFNNRDSFHLGIFRKGGPLLGFVALFIENKSVATCNMIVGNKSFWGKRVPDEVLPAVFEYFFMHTEVIKFKFETIGDNRSSIAGQKRIGAKIEGILREEKESCHGGRVDLHLFGLLKSEWQQRHSNKTAADEDDCI